MTDGLWWLPSLIVFGTVGIGVVAGLRVAASRRRTLRAGARDTLAALEQQAGIALVRADDRVHSAEEEVDFAVAQFGEAAAKEFADAVTSAREKLREAFRLHQQLADAVPDSESQRQRWNRQIVDLCTQVTEGIALHTTGLDRRRAIERDAPDHVEDLDRRISMTGTRLVEAESILERLTAAYAPATIATVTDAPSRARKALSQAREAVERATARVAAREAAADALDSASSHLTQARQALDSVTTTAARLDSARTELAAAIEHGRAAVEEARRLRDEAEVPEAAAEIASGLDIMTAAIARAAASSALPDPLGRLDELREAESRLDAALSSARSRQQRIDSAREALRGALFSARSHLDVASAFIAGNRGRVGPDARTRLAEAERQLALAEAADDPVEALDTARRVSRLAQDADALARYDAGPRTAPIRD